AGRERADADRAEAEARGAADSADLATGARWLMPRSRAPGCAVWRVRAAHAPAIAPLRGAPAGACASRRQPLTDTDVSASGCRRAPERPAHAPSGRSHGINHLVRPLRMFDRKRGGTPGIGVELGRIR